jgi:DNA-binding MarR family transcriptional regulator
MSVIGKPVDDRAGSHAAAETPCNCASIRQAARRVTRLYDQALAPCGLRITQYPVLSWLAATGPMTMHVLAERIGVDRATLGHNLRPLEARGLVTMVAGNDRRSRVVALTAAGRQLLNDARPAWKTAQITFETAFGKEDSAALRATMLRMARLDFADVRPGTPTAGD